MGWKVWQRVRRNEAGRLLDFDTDQEGRSDSWRLADQGQACTGITVKNLTISKSLLTSGARLPLEWLVAAERVAVLLWSKAPSLLHHPTAPWMIANVA